MTRDELQTETIDNLLKQKAKLEKTAIVLKVQAAERAAAEKRALKALERSAKVKTHNDGSPVENKKKTAANVSRADGKKIIGMLHAQGEAIKEIHSQTTPELAWLPSAVLAIILVYPLQSFILDTAPNHKLSAVLSGVIKDAKQYTSDKALKWGIEWAGGTTIYSSPLKNKLEVTSAFNKARKHPVTGEVTPHNGTDYRCATGDAVYAMQSGIVVHAADTGNAGNMITIQHSSGEKSIYMHLDSMDVEQGEKISTGEAIGECGNTGRSTGSHLHVGLMKPDGTYIDPVTVIGIANAADMWEFFKDVVAQSESEGSGGYTAETPSGTYKGKYQMDRDAIAYAGYGNVSWAEFLSKPALQEEIYKAWQSNNIKAGRHGISAAVLQRDSGLRGFITDSTPAYKIAGFLHAAQFGQANALRWYTEGVDFKDGNGVKISDYASRGESAFIAKYGRFASGAALLAKIEG